jgi:hypothetical protein
LAPLPRLLAAIDTIKPGTVVTVGAPSLRRFNDWIRRQAGKI